MEPLIFSLYTVEGKVRNTNEWTDLLRKVRQVYS